VLLCNEVHEADDKLRARLKDPAPAPVNVQAVSAARCSVLLVVLVVEIAKAEDDSVLAWLRLRNKRLNVPLHQVGCDFYVVIVAGFLAPTVHPDMEVSQWVDRHKVIIGSGWRRERFARSVVGCKRFQ
jgi:hypothetical protein